MTDKTTHLPGAAELLEAVAEFLENKLLPELEGSRRFNTRVSINVLRIVQRELDRGSDAGLATELRALLDEKDEDSETLLLTLAERIRQGDFEQDNAALLEVLRHHVENRLAVDNPKYSGDSTSAGQEK